VPTVITPNMTAVETSAIVTQIINQVGTQPALWKNTAFRQDVYFNSSDTVTLLPVLQREYCVHDNRPDQLLTTTNVGDCIVLVLFGERKTGMIHIDHVDPSTALGKMLPEFEEPSLSVWLIGGEKESDGNNISHLQATIRALCQQATRRKVSFNIEYQLLSSDKMFPSRRIPLMDYFFASADRLFLQNFGQPLPKKLLKKPDDSPSKKWDEVGKLPPHAQRTAAAMINAWVPTENSMVNLSNFTQEEAETAFPSLFCKEAADLIQASNAKKQKYLSQLCAFAIDPLNKKILLISNLAVYKLSMNESIILRDLRIKMFPSPKEYVNAINFVPGNELTNIFSGMNTLLDDTPEDELWTLATSKRMRDFLLDSVLKSKTPYDVERLRTSPVMEYWLRYAWQKHVLKNNAAKHITLSPNRPRLQP